MTSPIAAEVESVALTVDSDMCVINICKAPPIIDAEDSVLGISQRTYVWIDDKTGSEIGGKMVHQQVDLNRESIEIPNLDYTLRPREYFRDHLSQSIVIICDVGRGASVRDMPPESQGHEIGKVIR